MLSLKQVVRSSLASKWASTLYASLVPGGLCILTLHRFGDEAPTAMPGMRLAVLDAVLTRLRRCGFRFMDLHAAIRALAVPGSLPRRTVVFTVDDGYQSVARGAEVFLAHDCPVTVFLSTGFVDGTTWLWWDEIEYICLHGAPRELRIEGLSAPLVLTDGGPQARLDVAMSLWPRCKLLPEADKQRLIRALAEQAEVDVPSHPPGIYAPLSWDKVRDLEAAGVRFGPHTVTHPILSRVDDAQSDREIRESWRRVSEQLDHPTPILAYPNGHRGDYGEREIRNAEAAGMVAAVTSSRGFATSRQLTATPAGRFSVPRFGEPADPDGACLSASGLDRIPQVWRRRRHLAKSA